MLAGKYVWLPLGFWQTFQMRGVIPYMDEDVQTRS